MRSGKVTPDHLKLTCVAKTAVQWIWNSASKINSAVNLGEPSLPTFKLWSELKYRYLRTMNSFFHKVCFNVLPIKTKTSLWISRPLPTSLSLSYGLWVTPVEDKAKSSSIRWYVWCSQTCSTSCTPHMYLNSLDTLVEPTKIWALFINLPYSYCMP
jgi:hypothetical protein